MTVLVTGGTGFVGSHTAAQLVRSGRAVRLLVRDPAKVARVPALVGVDVEVIVGDVTDRPSVAKAVDGCDAVVHAAAQVSLAASDSEQTEAINVGGTRNVLGEAAARALPAVTVSSTTVFRIDNGTITPETSLMDEGGSYTRSKIGAERVAREFQAAGAPLAIVYPSGVLGPDGPGVSVNHEALVVWIRTPPRTSSGTGVVDVRDVALGIEHALGQPGRWMFGGTFLTWSQMHDTLTRVTGVRRRSVPMPGRLLRLAGRGGDLVKRVRPFDFPLTLEAMTLASRAVPFDSRATQDVLGVQWRPVEETLRDSIRWLVSIGELDAKLAGSLGS